MVLHLLSHFGGLADIATANTDDLSRLIGNQPDAYRLQSLLRTASGFGPMIEIDHPIINDCASLVHYLQDVMGGCRVETFRVLFLNTHNKIITDEVLWTGTVSEVQIYPREVIRRALELDASAFIAAHNHPSNVVKPSNSDLRMTKNLIKAANVFNIAFQDHIIVSSSSFHSMRYHQSIEHWDLEHST